MDINTTRLRCLLGWLAILLSWIVVIFAGIFPKSISATWYTQACTPFMIILGSASILLISYKGYEKFDDILTTITGLFGFGICLFPTKPVEGLGIKLPLPFPISYQASNIIHVACAIVFFVLLAYNSFFLFTKSNGKITKEKEKRNIIFRICAIGMLASFSLMLLPEFYIQTWLMEMFALTFFGVSWLTKANYYPWLFADKK